MNINVKFWISMAVFQVIIGIAIFAITREYYIHQPQKVAVQAMTIGQSAREWPDSVTEAEINRLSSSEMSSKSVLDPAEISRLADESFANKRYDRAAELYEQLLAFDPDSAQIKNNLGLTLHYLGRSTEALRMLNDGLAADIEHQRTWLTLGFVNSQLGNIEQARTALTTATQIDGNDSIRQSALRMLEELP